ncbi:MAG TPA: TonB-dependent receptor, partial [Sphingomicrobium sp.]|nr:TonB-dependent receptor [Sphingomicrobium sp.]
FRELRDIPTEAIERVEILPEEVALKYGYAADQKVVNIVLRPRFRSTVAQIGGGAPTEGGEANVLGDATHLMINRAGRTQFNLHAEGNSMLTEAERNICLTQPCSAPQDETELGARSLVGAKRDVRGSAIVSRTILGNVSATLNGELEHNEGHSLIGFGDTLATTLDRNTTADTAHLGTTLNWDKAQWHWNVTGNADWAHDVTGTDRDNVLFPRDRAVETTTSGDLTATTNGNLFKVPAGDASTTLRVGLNTTQLDSHSRVAALSTSNSLGRTQENGAINVDLPISRRGKDFSALGNLTLNGNAEVNHLSDFGTLTKFGAGANWSPVDRLNFLTSWTREEGPPTINQLGDPVLTTPDTRIFDFTTGQTVLVTAITGGNPNLLSDTRTVLKFGGYWQPIKNTDLRLRADYVHQRIERPISTVTVTPTIEAAFPDRFVRDANGDLVSVDLRPLNFDSSRKDTLRIGFDFSHPLKSRRPSQSVIDQIRAQFRAARGGAPTGDQRQAQNSQGTSRGQNPTSQPPEQNGGTPSNAAPPPGPPPAESEGRGGGFGGRGFGGRRGGGGGGFFGGGNRGRIQFSLTDTITFVDKVTVAPGFPDVDYLHGDAAGQSGGTPRHSVEAQAGYFNNGLGARIGADWRSATHVNTLTGDNLHFSPLATFDLRLFANPGDIPEVAVKHPWMRGTQVRFEVNNVFDSRPKVHDAFGNVPINYQPDLLDPLGRTIMISFRKLFLPSFATMRRDFQRDQQSQTR